MRKVLLAIVLTASSAFDTPTTAVTEGFAARGPEIVSVGNDVYPSSTTIMMAVYGDGIFKSTDSGAALTESNAGLPNGNVIWINRNLAALPAHQMAMDGGGIYESTDTGTSWTAVNSGLLCGYFNHISANTATPATLYAGTGCSSTHG